MANNKLNHPGCPVLQGAIFSIAFLISCSAYAQPGAMEDIKNPFTALAKFNMAADSGAFGYLDEVLIVKDGATRWHQKWHHDYGKISKGYSGKMGCGYGSCASGDSLNPYNYYHPQQHPYFKAANLHTIQSITKSIIATLIGIAQKKGHILRFDLPLSHWFQETEFSNSALWEHFKKATLADALTMRLGLDWEELGLSLEDENDVSTMELEPNWLAYVLSKNPIQAPGTHFNYNSGASILLAAILERSCPGGLIAFAEAELFKPLGIDDWHWKQSPGGLVDGEGGLYLGARDLAKIGRLYLQKGLFEGQQIFAPSFWDEALFPHNLDLYKDGGTEGYGYQWWLMGTPVNRIVGLGYGHQILLIIPEKNIVAVVFSWNVFDPKGRYVFGDLIHLLESGF